MQGKAALSVPAVNARSVGLIASFVVNRFNQAHSVGSCWFSMLLQGGFPVCCLHDADSPEHIVQGGSELRKAKLKPFVQ